MAILRALYVTCYDALFGELYVNIRLLVCLSFVLGLFLLSRLPFFLYYPLPIAAPDTATYLWQVEKLDQGLWPTFEFRTPGYPLFWWLCHLLSHNVLVVIYAQNTITLCTIMTILWLLSRHVPRLLLPAAFTLAVFISSPTHLALDVFLLSESIFVNALLLSVTLLYLALHMRRLAYAVLASFLAAAAILIRPNAAFLIPVFGLAIGYIWIRKLGRQLTWGLALPLVGMLSALVLYNLVTIRVFGLSAGQDWGMLLSVMIYIEPDPALPETINHAILEKAAQIREVDKDIIYHSWDLTAFRHAMQRYYTWDAIVPVTRGLHEPQSTPEPYLQDRPMMRRIFRIALQQHPEVYIKNFLGVCKEYFDMISMAAWGDFYSFWPAEQYRSTFVERAFYMDNLRSYYDLLPPPDYSVTTVDGTRKVTAPARRLTQWYTDFTLVRASWFDHSLWNWPLLLGLAASLCGLWWSRGASTGSFVVLLLLACLAGHAAVCGMAGVVEKRYSYTLEFVNYLLFALGVSGLAQGLHRRLTSRDRAPKS